MLHRAGPILNMLYTKLCDQNSVPASVAFHSEVCPIGFLLLSTSATRIIELYYFVCLRRL